MASQLPTWTLALGGALLAGVVSPRAYAADPAPDAQQDAAANDDSAAKQAQATRHFQTAVKLYKDGNYAGALAEFEVAYELKPGPSSLKNIALCHKALFRYAEAAETLAYALKVHEKELTADEVAAIQAAMDELKSLVGSIVLSVRPKQALVSVDGKRLAPEQIGRTLRLNVGEHTLVAEAPGYAKVTQVIRVAGGQNDVAVNLELQATSGFVTVRAESHQDAIAIDGKFTAYGSWTGPLSPGEHYLQVYRDNHEQYELRFKVEAGKSRKYQAPGLLKSNSTSADSSGADSTRQLRGWYGLVAVNGLSMRNDPEGLDIENADVSGGTFGVRAGYRLWTPIGVELLFEGGRFDIKNACDEAANTPCGDNSGLKRELTMNILRVGPAVRIMSGGEQLRFTSALSTGAVQHRVELTDPNDAQRAANAQEGGKAQGWDPYFALELGIQYNWGHVLLEAVGIVFLDGASNVQGDRSDGSPWSPYADSGGILMGGLGLRAGWSEWTPDDAKQPSRPRPPTPR